MRRRLPLAALEAVEEGDLLLQALEHQEDLAELRVVELDLLPRPASRRLPAPLEVAVPVAVQHHLQHALLGEEGALEERARAGFGAGVNRAFVRVPGRGERHARDSGKPCLNTLRADVQCA